MVILNDENMTVPLLDYPFSSNETYVIYGTGEVARSYYKDITEKLGIESIAFFVDSMKKMDYLFGKNIYCPYELKNMSCDEYKFILATYSSAISMENELLKVGISRSQIIQSNRYTVDSFANYKEDIKNILLYPEIPDIQTIQKLLEKINWYIPILKKSELHIDLLYKSQFEIQEDIELLRHIHQATTSENKKYDLILVWDKRSLGDLFLKKYQHVYCIDVSFFQFIDIKILTMINEKICVKKTEYAELSQQNFQKLVEMVQKDSVAYVFGAGPSFLKGSKYCESKRKKNDIRIVCNACIKNKEAIQYCKPNLYVISDSGFLTPEFQDIMDDVVEYCFQQHCYLFVNESWLPLLVEKYPDIKNIMIGLREDASEITFPTPEKRTVYSKAHNIITRFAIPVASSLVNQVYIAGCDGAKLVGNSFEMKHFDERTILLKKYDILNHHHYFEELLSFGERNGKNYISCTKSNIPALKERGRVLAVIPARAGSKGIPNKNLRILKNKPLIWYSIQNALNSKYITDVVVSTDSDLIGVLCEQLQVKVKYRKETLCGDDVTLDAVVYDACKNYKADYVVTLQPTSPTLGVETLDNAILFAMQKEFDSVISVINKPHLSWKEENGTIVPDYQERLNRQYLPACYQETGSFVISKGDIISENSRLGTQTQVYEISEREAIDIDTFTDLIVAESYLQQPEIAFWVNGNNHIGLGHISRVLELADEFYVKPDIYYDVQQTDRGAFGITTHNVIGVDGQPGFLEKVKAKNYSLIINDVLDTELSFMKILRTQTKGQIVNFEDDGPGRELADIVINALYEESTQENVVCGEKFYIIPKIFMCYEPIVIKEVVKKVFICFGGADPRNYTDRILTMISKVNYSSYEFIVVLGRAKQNVEELMQYNEKGNIQVLYDVENMPKLMSQCDIAITSCGRTGYELAYLGIPTIAMAQNNREERHSFICNRNGYLYLGANPSNEIIEKNISDMLVSDADERLQYQLKLLEHDLTNGRHNIKNLLKLNFI